MSLLISQEIKPPIRTKQVTRFLQLATHIARLTESYSLLQNFDELKIGKIKPNSLETNFPTDDFSNADSS
jgi:division protein CdvB (Snf7/Vps24/ESCRT-III family)